MQSKLASGKKHFERDIFLASLIVFGVSISSIISREGAIHFALAWSLSNGHSVFLNSTVYAYEPYTTQLGAHTVSLLPPGLAFLAFPFVGIALFILPMDPAAAGVYLATYFSVIVGSLASVLFFKMARMFSARESSCALLATIFAFGTPMWAYSRLFLPEALATLFGMASIYLVLKGKPKTTVFSGIMLGLMVFVDNMGIFLAIPVLAYLILTSGRKRYMALLGFVGGFLVGTLPVGIYDMVTTGRILFSPYGMPVLGGVPASAYNPSLGGFFETLVSTQSGIFFFSPFLILLLVGILLAFRGRRSGREFEQGILFPGLFLAILVPLSLQTGTYLQNTIGPSEIVLGMPYALLLCLVPLERMLSSKRGTVIIFLLGAASVFINGFVALTEPAILGQATPNPLFTTNIPLFLAGDYLTWWSFFQYPILYACLVLILPLAILMIYSLNARAFERHEKKVVEIVAVTR